MNTSACWGQRPGMGNGSTPHLSRPHILLLPPPPPTAGPATRILAHPGLFNPSPRPVAAQPRAPAHGPASVADRSRETASHGLSPPLGGVLRVTGPLRPPQLRPRGWGLRLSGSFSSAADSGATPRKVLEQEAGWLAAGAALVAHCPGRSRDTRLGFRVSQPERPGPFIPLPMVRPECSCSPEIHMLKPPSPQCNAFANGAFGG